MAMTNNGRSTNAGLIRPDLSIVQVLFSPAIALMNRLGYTKKFALLWLVSLAAIAVVAYGFFVSLDRIISPSERQLNGLALIKPISKTVQFIQLHRGISALLLGGSNEANEAMWDRRAAEEREAVEAFNAMEEKLPPSLISNERLPAHQGKLGTIAERGIQLDGGR